MDDEKQLWIIAVDFDGCLCTNKWPDIGDANIALIKYLKDVKEQLGYKLILWTCREGDMLRAAVFWCLRHGLIFDAINDNLPEITEKFGINCRKVFANRYIDNKAIRMDAAEEIQWKNEVATKLNRFQEKGEKAMGFFRRNKGKKKPDAGETKLWKSEMDEPKAEKPLYGETAEWWVFNAGTLLEFAECSECGQEEEPSLSTMVDTFPKETELAELYPKVCPKCHARMVDTVAVRDEDMPDGAKENYDGEHGDAWEPDQGEYDHGTGGSVNPG